MSGVCASIPGSWRGAWPPLVNGHQVGGASYLAGCSVIALCVWEMRRGLVGYVRLGVDQTITESNPIQSNIMSPRRARMAPATLGMLSFLHVNKALLYPALLP